MYECVHDAILNVESISSDFFLHFYIISLSIDNCKLLTNCLKTAANDCTNETNTDSQHCMRL